MGKDTEYRKGMDIDSIILSFKKHEKYTMAKDKYTSTDWDHFYSLARVVTDRLIERWIKTQQTYYEKKAKRIYYMSMEFLMGRLLGNNLFNLTMYDETQKALKQLDINIEDIREVEVDAGLGNGGLGRLAACYLDSMATLELPGYGYGIRYEFGMFKQLIEEGFQVEAPDNWLMFGNPWEIARPEYRFEVKFYGRVENRYDKRGEYKPVWVDSQTVIGIPYDTPIPGYDNNTVNTLRLWSATASDVFDLEIFNDGDYIAAVENKNLSEVISKVLYPNDNVYEGKELRLKQEYFFVSCSLQDILRRFKKTFGNDFSKLPDNAVIQLNDTHPALGIAELMHILIDQEHLVWDKAWNITRETFAFTNHTLLPEALEKWPVHLLERLLPRHVQIIYEINRRFLAEVSRKFLNDHHKLRALSIIEEGHERQIRMANLCVIGSKSTNGVAELHTNLLKSHVFKDFYEFCPEKFNNKTNGITQRRWLLKSNQGLATLISDTIGNAWTKKLDGLKELEKYAEDKAFRKKFREVKLENKKNLAAFIEKECGIQINPDSIFDVQVKRIHEYKRQLLFAIAIVIRYIQLKNNPGKDFHPMTYIIGGKSAPGYHMAKLIIKLINSIAEEVNNDPQVSSKIKVVFIPNYRISVAEKIFPASDISEQISTAGWEASGTGNMKFSLNGALTLGTLDGANVEIREEVGAENFYLFGHTVDQLAELQSTYNPMEIYNNNPEIKEALDLIHSDYFSPMAPELFSPIYHALLSSGDRYFLLADLEDYLAKKDLINKDYQDQENWSRKAILNVARMGKFSSDRSIQQYADEIWKSKPIPIELD